MSPRTYGFLWTLVLAAAGVMWLAGVFTLLTVVVFGFIAFGMTFMGMMCVLPSTVAHSGPQKHQVQKTEAAAKPIPPQQAKTVNGFSTFRSA